MAGASAGTKRVSFVSANWTADAEGAAGHFELQVVTEDEERHAVHVTAPDMAALVALTQASEVLLWDPEVGTLIAGNVVGEWLPPTWTSRH